MTEEVVHFGAGDGLVGVIARPREATTAPALLLCNAGIVHRVGPHRLYVKLAQRLAAAGIPVFRLDLSGIGDSPMRDERAAYDEIALGDLEAAMDRLQERFGVERFVTSGICSGGQFAFEAACRDERVVGAVPINAALHLHDSSDDELSAQLQRAALSRHYWRIALRSSFRRKNLRKALTQQLDVPARIRVMLGRLVGRGHAPVRAISPRAHANAVLDALAARGVHVLHVYSEGDEWLDYFDLVIGDDARSWPTGGAHRLEVIAGVDHTFTMLWSQDRLMDLISDWMAERGWCAAPDSARSPGPSGSPRA